ncbi:transposase [Streptomyces sp. QHH-9511]|nr:transposase [Streptomyces sp. QHH-9511]
MILCLLTCGNVAPLLPPRPSRRRRYPGRLPADDRAALRGIVYVFRKGVSGADVPTERIGCSGVTAWRRLRDWTHWVPGSCRRTTRWPPQVTAPSSKRRRTARTALTTSTEEPSASSLRCPKTTPGTRAPSCRRRPARSSGPCSAQSFRPRVPHTATPTSAAVPTATPTAIWPVTTRIPTTASVRSRP